MNSLKESVPPEVPGIAFLSGGQSDLEATENLNQINIHNNTNFKMTYSFGRALQQSALKLWSKDINNIKGTQDIFNKRAKMYADNPKVEAKDKSISPAVTKKTRGITINIITGSITKTD